MSCGHALDRDLMKKGSEGAQREQRNLRVIQSFFSFSPHGGDIWHLSNILWLRGQQNPSHVPVLGMSICQGDHAAQFAAFVQ